MRNDSNWLKRQIDQAKESGNDWQHQNQSRIQAEASSRRVASVETKSFSRFEKITDR